MAETWWDGVTIQVEMAFGEPPTAPTSWTDITADVRDIPFGSAGRRSEFVQFAPSTAQLVLDNATRQYDPDYATGPYFGDLVPMVPCRITATVAATDVDVFYGYVKGWPQDWGRFDATTRVTLIDGSRFQQNRPLNESAYAQDLLADEPDWYWPMQELEGRSVIGDTDAPAQPWRAESVFGLNSPILVTDNRETTPTAASDSTANLLYPLGQTSGIGSSDTTQASILFYEEGDSAFGGDIVRTNPPTCLSLWAKGSSVATSAGNAVNIWMRATETDYIRIFVRDSGLVEVGYQDSVNDVGVTSSSDPVPIGAIRSDRKYHIAVVFDTIGSTFAAFIDGVPAGSGSLVANVSSGSGDPRYEMWIAGDAVVSHVALWWSTTPTETNLRTHGLSGLYAYGHPYGERTGERIGRALDSAGWPTALRDIDTGTQVCGPYLPKGARVLTHARQLEATEQGLLFVASNGKVRFIDRESLWTAADTGIVFTDDEAAGDVRLAGLVPDGNTVDTIRNIVTVGYKSTRSTTRQDDTSADMYGEAVESVDSPPMPDVAAASNMAAYILRAKKDPTTRYTSMTATVRGQDGNTTRILDLIQRNIGDVVTIERLPVEITPQVVKKAMIQGYRFRISRQDWVVDFYLSPAVAAAPDVPYLTLGDADDGKIGATDANIIPA